MPFIRVRFDLAVDDGFPPVSSELIFGSALSNERVRIDNTPFFVECVAVGDIVQCSPVAEGDIVNFIRMEQRSGNRSLSIIFIDSRIEEEVYQYVRNLGHYCEYGEFPEYSMLAVSVAKESDIFLLTSYLKDMQDNDKLSYAELCL
jgi:hypothetical protein